MKFRNIYLTSLAILTSTVCFAQSIDTKDLMPEKTFTTGIEGPATDQYGNLYAVNYAQESTGGIVRPDGSHGLYVTLPKGSDGNSIHFTKNGTMLIADYMGHNILAVDTATKKISVFVHETRMHQPNDITIAPNGNIYASDPDWKNNKGQLWLIRPNGKTTLLETNMGTTNGIEVSPDGKTLYVDESVQLKVWAYTIKKDGTLTNKRLFHSFEGYGMDGMKCDVKGNIYLCRYDKGTIAVMDKKGTLLKEIQLKGKKPSNLTFGGADRRLCYVTLQDRGCFETFIAPNPGRK